MFDQSQIQEFKEAFNMIDQNRDGFIDKEDLHDMLASLGTQACCPYAAILRSTLMLQLKGRLKGRSLSYFKEIAYEVVKGNHVVVL